MWKEGMTKCTHACSAEKTFVVNFNLSVHLDLKDGCTIPSLFAKKLERLKRKGEPFTIIDLSRGLCWTFDHDSSINVQRNPKKRVITLFVTL